MRRTGLVRIFNARRGQGVITPLDGTDELRIRLDDGPSPNTVITAGTLVSFRERFHTDFRIATSLEALPANVAPLRMPGPRECTPRLWGRKT